MMDECKTVIYATDLRSSQKRCCFGQNVRTRSNRRHVAPLSLARKELLDVGRPSRSRISELSLIGEQLSLEHVTTRFEGSETHRQGFESEISQEESFFTTSSVRAWKLVSNHKILALHSRSSGRITDRVIPRDVVIFNSLQATRLQPVDSGRQRVIKEFREEPRAFSSGQRLLLVSGSNRPCWLRLGGEESPLRVWRSANTAPCRLVADSRFCQFPAHSAPPLSVNRTFCLNSMVVQQLHPQARFSAATSSYAASRLQVHLDDCHVRSKDVRS